MGKVIIDSDEFDVAEDSKFIEQAEAAGVAFGCTDGICGSCRIEVDEGMENLTELTQEEKDFGCEGKERLCCQCKLKSGFVKIRYF